jgi:hypothetical protein
MFARAASLAFLAFAALFLSANLRAEPDAALTPVRGKVILDGEPMAKANVTFHPEAKDGKKATGLTAEDGTYVLKTDGAEGAAPGKYIITISLKRGDKEVIPLKYTDKATSDIVVEVTKGQKDYDIKLTK